MRFTRLRRAIEDGTLIDNHGKQFQGGADKIAEAQKKRKKPSSEDADCDGDDEEPVPSQPRKKASRSPGVGYEAESCNVRITSEGEISSPAGTHMDTKYKTSIENPSSDPTTENIGHGQPPTAATACDVKAEVAKEAQRHVLPTATLLTQEQCKRREELLGPVKQVLAIRQPEDSSRIQKVGISNCELRTVKRQ